MNKVLNKVSLKRQKYVDVYCFYSQVHQLTVPVLEEADED